MNEVIKTRTLMGVAVFLMTIGSQAQVNLRDSVVSMSMINFSVGGHIPAGDLSDRFGESGYLGVSYSYKTGSNFIFGIEGGFIFGSKVKEDVAVHIRNSQGFVIDQEGQFTELLLLERGMTLMATGGKVIPLLGPNPNSGLLLKVGAGMLQHNIRLETRNNDVPQLEGEYLKGYDRLSNGFSSYQFIGYQFLSNQRKVNFSIGIEGYQAWTKSRRDFNFDIMGKDETDRFDSLYGVKLTWSFLIYRRAAGNIYR